MGQAENGNPADVPVQLMDGVNVTNGNLFLSDLHFQFNGTGPTFGLQVAYNARADSALTPNTPLGRKWTHNLNWFVELDPDGSLLVHKGDGEIVRYPLSCRQDVNRTGGLDRRPRHSARCQPLEHGPGQPWLQSHLRRRGAARRPGGHPRRSGGRRGVQPDVRPGRATLLAVERNTGRRHHQPDRLAARRGRRAAHAARAWSIASSRRLRSG